MSEEPNRPDHVVAQEFWNNFTARNQSIIVDLMYGQLKSTVTCLTCGRIATAFDPFLSVQLPLEQVEREEKMRFHFVPIQMHDYIEEEQLYTLKPIPVVEMKVTKSTTIIDIKRQMNATLKMEGLAPGDLLVCAQHKGKVTKRIGDYELCKDVEKLQKMIYHVPKETREDMAVELNWFRHKRLSAKNYTIKEVENKCIARFA